MKRRSLDRPTAFLVSAVVTGLRFRVRECFVVSFLQSFVSPVQLQSSNLRSSIRFLKCYSSLLRLQSGLVGVFSPTTAPPITTTAPTPSPVTELLFLLGSCLSVGGRLLSISLVLARCCFSPLGSWREESPLAKALGCLELHHRGRSPVSLLGISNRMTELLP